jgi:gamma-glutamyltranspeptidase / glutathione hydrolase
MASAAIASSDPRAAQAGADVLSAGGNAIDAAVAAVLVLFVTEPQSCGPGGDAFLVVGKPDGLVEALDGSGSVPAGLTEHALAADGLEAVPVRGGRSVTVPGALGLLAEALARHGTMSLRDLVAPALGLARDGFTVRRTLAETSARAAGEIARDPVLGPLYAPGGRPLATGDVVCNPALATLLDQVASEGVGVLYNGPIGEALVERVREDGGYLSMDDLRAHVTSVVNAVSTSFAGATVWELPLPTQGPAVVHALDAIDAEAPIDWAQVLEATISGLRSVGIDLERAAGSPPRRGPSDTTYVAVMDREGRAASMITSVFADFGSHLGVAELGGPIHNRATAFYAMRLPPRPGKPPHTTIPGLVTRGGLVEHVLGLAGGYVQAQVQVQLILHLLLEGLAPQDAIDAPRMRMLFGGAIALEPGHPLSATFPDAVGRPTGPEAYGAAQVVSSIRGHVRAGADPRRDGRAIEID